MKSRGSKNFYSYSNKKDVILGACSATDYTSLISSRSQTSKFLVRAFSLSFFRSSAILLTSLCLTSETPPEPPLLEVGLVVLLSVILALWIAIVLLPLDFSY
jgi:hypothetical protein